MREPLTMKGVLDGLLERNLIAADEVPGIVQHLQERAGETALPWFVRTLVTLGAWTAAVCFVVFLAIADLLPHDGSALAAWGLLFIGGALGLQYLRNLFCKQLALALSSGGHAMLLWGLAKVFDGFGVVPCAAAVLCAVLYPFYREPLHRFLSTLLVPVMAVAWLMKYPESMTALLPALFLLEMALMGAALVAWRDEPALRPAGYAMAAALLLTPLLVLLPQEQFHIVWWPSSATLGAGALALIHYLSKSARAFRGEPAAWAVAGTVALAAVSTPGLLAAGGLLALGYALRERKLEGLSLLFIPIFLFVFYYHLDLTLLRKSYLLAASGAVLLLIRAVIVRRPWAKEAL